MKSSRNKREHLIKKESISLKKRASRNKRDYLIKKAFFSQKIQYNAEKCVNKRKKVVFFIDPIKPFG